MTEERVTTTGWLLLVLGFFLTVVQLLNLLAPAGLLTAIMEQTGWSVTQAGYLLTVMAPVSGIFIFAGSPLMDKLGLAKTAFFGLLLMGVGNLLAVVFNNIYALQLCARLVLGVGVGAITNVPAVIIAYYFPPKMQSSLQGVRTAIMYTGMALAFYIIIPIFRAVGESWQWTLGVFGFVFIILAFLFLLFGKQKTAAPAAAAHGGGVSAPEAPPVKQESGLKQAAKKKEVWMITIVLFFILWSFNSYNNFFATFLQQVRGLDMTVASSFTGLMPIAGIVSGIVCGAISSATGRRNLVNAPLIILMLLGYLGATLLDPTTSRGIFVACLLVGGFGASGYTIYYCTVPTEWEGTTPALIGGAFAIFLGIGSTFAFVIPSIFGALTNAIGMKNAMLWMHLPLVISIVVALTMKETGPGGKKK